MNTFKKFVLILLGILFFTSFILCIESEENEEENETGDNARMMFFRKNEAEEENEEEEKVMAKKPEEEDKTVEEEEKEETKSEGASVLQSSGSTTTTNTNSPSPRIGSFTLDTQTLWLLFGIVGGLLVLILGILGLASAIAIIAMCIRSCTTKKATFSQKEVVRAGEPMVESVGIVNN